MYTFFKKLIKGLPKRPLTNIDIIEFTRNIPYFRGVFMRDELPKKPNKFECAIVNLDSSQNEGTHWVAYAKIGNYCEYFDSFGNLKPPLELTNYLNGLDIYYNYNRYQSFETTNCGHLSIMFLKYFWKKHAYKRE